MRHQDGATFPNRMSGSIKKHYFCTQDIKANLSSVYLPNMETITTTYQGLLHFNNLSQEVLTTKNILPNLQSASLSSLGQLCSKATTSKSSTTPSTSNHSNKHYQKF